ncbi:hypothetical protein NA56DRAFT_704640 [Hyaloscypha hepaticicola]|uniref:Uncharacterized protein n=1 Tax=Hyaloscypha hepaticicola TaxID=2082293 RepID=A0A2J6Q257_9HELO|nr:hypothetical protein NA56DRAFT_704640 [Hyaloscypha hepaticicola]
MRAPVPAPREPCRRCTDGAEAWVIGSMKASLIINMAFFPKGRAECQSKTPSLELSSSPPPTTTDPSLLGSFKLRGSGTWLAHLCLLWDSSAEVAEAFVPLSDSAPNAPKAPGVEEASKLLFTAPALDHELQQPQRIAGPEGGPSSDRLISDTPT